MAAQPRPPILLTRPAAASARFAEQIRRQFGQVAVTISPLMVPRILRPVLPEGPHAAVIFTSETAVGAAGPPSDMLPVRAFCVGDRTAAAATAAGYDAVSAQGDAAALADLIGRSPPDAPVLHLRGADTRGDLAATLAARGIRVDEAVVYDQRPLPLTPAALDLLAGQGAVLVPLFSPRSAALFGHAVGAARAPLLVVALSDAVAAAAPPAARIVVAERPDAKAMLAAIDMLGVM